MESLYYPKEKLGNTIKSDTIKAVERHSPQMENNISDTFCVCYTTQRDRKRCSKRQYITQYIIITFLFSGTLLGNVKTVQDSTK